jgi:hypothetical protein
MGLGYETLPPEYFPLLESDALEGFISGLQEGIDAVW